MTRNLMAELFTIVVTLVSAHYFLRGHKRVLIAQCNRLNQHNAALKGARSTGDQNTLGFGSGVAALNNAHQRQLSLSLMPHNRCNTACIVG